MKIGQIFVITVQYPWSANGVTRMHTFRCKCVVSGMDQFNAQYEVLEVLAETNRPTRAPIQRAPKTGGFSLTALQEGRVAIERNPESMRS